MSMGARRELISTLRERYGAADRKDKGQILDELVSASGYNRKYAITLLKGHPSSGDGDENRAQNGEQQGSSGSLEEKGETGGEGKEQGSEGGKRKPKTRLYDESVKKLLVKVWKMSGKLCSRRLRPFLGELMEVLERNGRSPPMAEVEVKRKKRGKVCHSEE
jgi:hypothetical protein